MSLSVLERLREATRPAHERLEERLDMLSKLGSVEQRRTLAAAFHRLHAGMERELAPWLADLDGLDFDDRRRSLVLDADLAALGATAPAPTAAPRPAGRAEALGLMYVLEGSSLGGKVIRKYAERAGLDMSGLGFLDPYGERTGQAWRSFLAVLERECPAQDEALGQAAARGGVMGFAHAEQVLLDGSGS